MKLQQVNQSKKWLIVVVVVVVTAVFAILQLRPQPTQLALPAVPLELSEVEDTSPLPEINPEMVNCGNWIRLESLEPGMTVVGPAVIFPYVVPRELAAAVGVKWRPRWGYSIVANQTVTIPETVIDSSTGEAVVPDGNVRYFTDDLNLTIAEASHFAEACK